MRISSALLFVLMLGFTASAAPEFATTGPYNVSFDMNTSLNYTVQSDTPISDALRTAYPLRIKTNDSFLADIRIYKYKDLTDSTPQMWQTINRQGLTELGWRNITLATDMIIDGMPAYGLAGQDSANRTYYTAYYWLDSKECECGPVSIGTTNVIIISSYPLALTGNLLDTLHIEISREAERQEPLTFAPPKA